MPFAALLCHLFRNQFKNRIVISWDKEAMGIGLLLEPVQKFEGIFQLPFGTAVSRMDEQVTAWQRDFFVRAVRIGDTVDLVHV